MKQGVQGVSLKEQRDAIERYAKARGFKIVRWFEERETAAKRGRPIFTQMVQALRQGEAQGLLIHKVDRGARNFRDWADLGELLDAGVDVHFVHDSMDLRSRGGRLSADIQAVIAADYIRNLREEVRKGFYGRLKQGLYPLPAPIGYVDRGRGRPKDLNPRSAPLLRTAFEMYATARYTISTLGDELWRLGLRNRRGGRVTRTGISNILNNPFYMGLIRIRVTGESFRGAHKPLISKTLFDRVQTVLRGRTYPMAYRHEFIFRGLLRCRRCGHMLTGEAQKRHVYYRCHTRMCARNCIREDVAERQILETLQRITLSDPEMGHMRQTLIALRHQLGEELRDEGEALALRKTQLSDRLDRLTDAYVDGLLDKDVYERRKLAILSEEATVKHRVDLMSQESENSTEPLGQLFELINAAIFNYNIRIPAEKRDLIQIVSSNREVEGKTLAMTLSEPFQTIAERSLPPDGAPYEYSVRTLDALVRSVFDWFKAQPERGKHVLDVLEGTHVNEEDQAA